MSEARARILLVEDDPSIALGLRINLSGEGYEVEVAGDGETGLRLARQGYDLLLLDLMLPRRNGFELLRTLRADGDATPVIVLTARTAELDKVTGLDLGADDYVTKPFSLAELLARIRVALRRNGPARSAALRVGELELDPDRREVTVAGERVTLTATEFDVLLLLVRSRGRVLSRQQIYDAVWGHDHRGTVRTVDNFVHQLRAKLEGGGERPRHVLTVRGVGYRVADEEDLGRAGVSGPP